MNVEITPAQRRMVIVALVKEQQLARRQAAATDDAGLATLLTRRADEIGRTLTVFHEAR